MQTKIVKMGNSHGIRIPKPMLVEAGLSGEVEIKQKGQSIVILPRQNPREGWAEQAAQLSAMGEDKPLIEPLFDDEEID